MYVFVSSRGLLCVVPPANVSTSWIRDRTLELSFRQSVEAMDQIQRFGILAIDRDEVSVFAKRNCRIARELADVMKSKQFIVDGSWGSIACVLLF